MNSNTYKARFGFLLPIFLDSLFILVLFVISIFDRVFTAEPVILFLIFVLTLCIVFGSARRKTTIGDEGIRIRKLFRVKQLRWEDITNVDVMALHKKVYLLLTTTRGFHTLANSHGDFTSLVKDVVRYVDQEKVEEGVQDVIEHPVKRISDIVSAWVAFIILLGAIVLKII
ncbi:MAG: PH domain-containing protein [Thermodesulfobacteriota bacterium]|nr:PH domain-containing protein [Thermodesulfobacteriota bacterium]